MLRKRPGGALDCPTVKGSLSVSVLGRNRASPELLSRCPGGVGADRAADGVAQAPGPSCVGPSPPAWVLTVQGALVPQPALRLPLDSGPRKQLLPQLRPGGVIHSLPCRKRLNSHVGGCVLDL